jgi:hypothetical protein
MTGDSYYSDKSVGDVLSKIGRAVADGATGEGPPELLLTENMRVWDAVPLAAAAAATPAIDEGRLREIVAESVLDAISSNAEIGALIRRAAKPKLEDVQKAMREAVGPMVDAAVARRMDELKQAVTNAVAEQVSSARAGLEAMEDTRKKQARKAVRAELKALLAQLDEE